MSFDYKIVGNCFQGSLKDIKIHPMEPLMMKRSFVYPSMNESRTTSTTEDIRNHIAHKKSLIWETISPKWVSTAGVNSKVQFNPFLAFPKTTKNIAIESYNPILAFSYQNYSPPGSFCFSPYVPVVLPSEQNPVHHSQDYPQQCFPLYRLQQPPLPLPKIDSPNTPSPPTTFTGQKKARQKGILAGKAYASRNVYKAILRYLQLYVKKNAAEVYRVLKETGFKNEEIAECFNVIRHYSILEFYQGSKKNAQSIIRKMASDACIFTYVLREALNAMLQNWNNGKLGKISEASSSVYKEVCGHYYSEMVKLIGQSAQGKSFIF